MIMNDKIVKKAYVKPEFEVVNMELEKPLLTGSGNGTDFGGGGTWG